METAKGVGEQGGMNRQSTEDLGGTEKYSGWYLNDEYMSLHICANP